MDPQNKQDEQKQEPKNEWDPMTITTIIFSLLAIIISTRQC